MRVLLAVFTVVAGLSLVQKVPCMQTQWLNSDVRYSKMCYSDIPYLYVPRGMAEQTWPYADTGGRYQVMEYPVGISYVAWGASLLTEPFASGPSEQVRADTPADDLLGLPGMVKELNTYFLVNAVLLLAVGLLAAFFMAGAHRRRPWDAIGFVASPCLLLTGLVNWDLLAVACVAGAFWAWARGKPVLTGIFLGVGAATKLYPLFLFGAMLVVCLRRSQVPVFVRALVAGAAAWAVLNVPVMMTGFAAVEGVLVLQLGARTRPRVAVADGQQPAPLGVRPARSTSCPGWCSASPASRSWCSGCWRSTRRGWPSSAS